jgi:hypothetical protein
MVSPEELGVAKDKGAEAARNGLGLKTCPYGIVEVRLRLAWADGYKSAGGKVSLGGEIKQLFKRTFVRKVH